MSVMTVNTATRTRLIYMNRPVRLRMSALLLVSSVRVNTWRSGSMITRGRLIFISFPLYFEKKED